MSQRHKNINNNTFIPHKQLNKSTINSSLINISKQLNNISINDINILKLKNEKIRMNSKNKTDSSLDNEFNNISINKSFKYNGMIYNVIQPFDQLYYINFSFCHIESFSIKADKNIQLLNKNDLRKKNYVLKENLKFLLNEIKKYKKNYDVNQIKEYENKIEYYIKEIKKYKKDIIILQEKYNNAIKENKYLQKYIQSELRKSNDLIGFHCISKTDINKSVTYNPNEIIIKKLNNKKKNNLNANSFNTLGKNNIKENYSTCTTRESRNNKTIDLNIINNINSNKYLLIDDQNSFQNSEHKKFSINRNLNNNNGFVINSKIINKNKNSIFFNKNCLKKLKRNNKNKINQIIFRRFENKKNKVIYNNRTLSKNQFNKYSLKNGSFELNKTINSSKSFKYC